MGFHVPTKKEVNEYMEREAELERWRLDCENARKRKEEQIKEMNKWKNLSFKGKIGRVSKIAGVSLTIASGLGFLGAMMYVEIDAIKNPKEYQEIDKRTAEKELRGTDYKIVNPNLIKLEKIVENGDTINAMIYPDGEIYLQQKDGSFISYEKVQEQEKAKIDSVYQARKDSLRKAYGNGLEKISQE